MSNCQDFKLEKVNLSMDIQHTTMHCGMTFSVSSQIILSFYMDNGYDVGNS
jgi:hypothetical protein